MAAPPRTTPSLRPAEPAVRAHEMGVYKRYFDLIATGRKTTEIWVNDSSRRKVPVGPLFSANRSAALRSGSWDNGDTPAGW